MRIRPAALVGLAIACLGSAPAVAHPHIFIDAKATILFNNDGELIGIRHAWTFDEAFSIWQIQGLDTNEDGVTSSEEMQELAEENMAGLAEYGFYTYAGEGSSTLPMASMDDARFTFEDGRSTLTFGVEPQGPYRIKDELEVAINDPEYYVAISFNDVSDITLENAPAGCSVRLEEPEPMSDDLAAQLYSLPPDVTLLPPELAAALRGVQGAVVVNCSAAVSAEAPALEQAPEQMPEAQDDAENAVEAVTEMAESGRGALPFGGPPPEPGFVLPKTGFLGWIAEQQRSFYKALTEALAALQRDNTAFWVLGSLSFFYGVFHAAGPGHGKVVISSYVLANEQQVRRGIALSFAASMLQAVVAIAFVLVAAAALNLTATAMGEAAGQIAIASYALVAVLGLWLIARKVFGWGHAHGHAKVPLSQKAHAHLHEGDHGHDHTHHTHDEHDHGHHHAVSPDQTTGNWREKLAVVLAVGLRPCSGALVVLAFSLSQGLLAAGIISTLLMGLGTGLTIAVLASIAVGLKGFAGGMAGANAAVAVRVVWWAELLGALLVFAFGVLLLLASL